MLSQDQIQAMIPDLEDAVRTHVKKQVIDGMTNTLSWTIESAIKEQTASFIKEHVVPDIQAHLLASKAGISAAVIEACEGIKDGIKQAILTKFTENLKVNYKVSQILKSLFD